MNILMNTAKYKAAMMGVLITRLDIQYNYHTCEYSACVWYTNGECYTINELGEIKKREA